MDWSTMPRGRAFNGQPLQREVPVVRLEICPDCDGRGWFLINPFRTGGTNGAGGVGNMTQCLTCKSAHEYFKQHGVLPPELQTLWEAKCTSTKHAS